MGEAIDALISVVHGQSDTLALEVVDVELGGGTSVSGGVSEGELSGSGGDKVGGSVLVTESVSTDADGLGPSRDGLGDLVENDGLSEDGSSEDVPYLPWDVRMKKGRDKMSGLNVTHSSVRASPHFLQTEFLDSSFVGGDGSALDTDRVLLDSLGRVDSDLVVGLCQHVRGSTRLRERYNAKRTASRLSIPKS